ncbi:MAG: flagellar protein FliS [Rickettsiaceae bacterium]
MVRNLYSQYKSKSIATSAPIDQVVFAFDESIKLMNKSIELRDQNKFTELYEKLNKVSKIFLLLAQITNDEGGGDTSKSFIDFCNAVDHEITYIIVHDKESSRIKKLLDSIKNMQSIIIGSKQFAQDKN